MIPIGGAKTFANEDITSPGYTLTFDTTPSAPLWHKVYFEINLLLRAADVQRTLTCTVQNTGQTVDYARVYPTVVDSEDSNYNQVVIGPFVLPYSTIIKLTIVSDYASDANVDANVRMLSDDAEYILHHFPAENGLVALSPASRLQVLDELTKASGAGDLAAMLTAAARLTAARAGVLTDLINDGRLDAIFDLILADTAELQGNQTDWATATSVTVSDKTEFKLASDGLDSVATTEPAGVASNFREMVVQTWRRFFKKNTLTATQLKTYKDDASIATTQPVSDDDTTQTMGDAS